MFFGGDLRGPDFDPTACPPTHRDPYRSDPTFFNFAARDDAGTQSATRTDTRTAITGDTADDAEGRSNIATCDAGAPPLPCVKRCKNRLKKCMLPWLKTHEPGGDKCGETSTEECLARYVCCIDEYCCEETECDEGTCVKRGDLCPPGCACCENLECDGVVCRPDLGGIFR